MCSAKAAKCLQLARDLARPGFRLRLPLMGGFNIRWGRGSRSVNHDLNGTSASIVGSYNAVWYRIRSNEYISGEYCCEYPLSADQLKLQTAYYLHYVYRKHCSKCFAPLIVAV